jgi:hypothetical protein
MPDRLPPPPAPPDHRLKSWPVRVRRQNFGNGATAPKHNRAKVQLPLACAIAACNGTKVGLLLRARALMRNTARLGAARPDRVEVCRRARYGPLSVSHLSLGGKCTFSCVWPAGSGKPSTASPKRTTTLSAVISALFTATTALIIASATSLRTAAWTGTTGRQREVL